MFLENILLLGSGLSNPGPWRAFADYQEATLQVTGYVSSVQIEVSNDRDVITNISAHSDPITANGIYKIETGARWIRATGVATVRMSARAID
jgi:hypothetical protein